MRKKDLTNDLDALKKEVLSYRGKYLWYKQAYDRQVKETQLKADTIAKQSKDIDLLLAALSKDRT